MVRPLNYSPKETLRIIKESCTPSQRIFLIAYKVSDWDTLMILADDYEELAAGSRSTTRRSMNTTPTATETEKKYLAEAAKQHTEARRCNPYHRPEGGLSKMWRERTLCSRMSKPPQRGERGSHGTISPN